MPCPYRHMNRVPVAVQRNDLSNLKITLLYDEGLYLGGDI